MAGECAYLQPAVWGRRDVIETGDADFDARFNVYGSDEAAVRDWLNQRRRRAIQEAAEHEVFVYQGAIIWSLDKSPLNVEELDKALQPMRYLASQLE